MAHPFEDEDMPYAVLRNAGSQYSLWPVSVDVPPGWEVVLGEAPRPDCVSYIEKTWRDMRPNGAERVAS